MNQILMNALLYEEKGAGISNYTKRLMETFLEEKYPLDILIRKEFKDRYEASNLIPIEEDIGSSTKRILEEQFRQAIKYKRYSLVHFPDYATPVFYRGAKIATIHDLAMRTMRSYYTTMQNLTKNILLEYTVRAADHLICDSKFSENQLLEFYPRLRGKTTVIHLGVDQPKIRVTEERSKDIMAELGIHNPFILFVGTLAPHKNLERLVRAFKEVKLLYPEYQLVVSGKKGWMFEGIFKVVEEEGLKDSVLFVGFTNDEQLEALYFRAQLLVLPSLYEGFGLPPLEAMIRGCPVLVSNLDIFKEICGEAASYCNPKETSSIVKEIITLLREENQRKKLIEVAYRKVKNYSWSKTAKQTFDVYEQTLERRYNL